MPGQCGPDAYWDRSLGRNGYGPGSVTITPIRRFPLGIRYLVDIFRASLVFVERVGIHVEFRTRAQRPQPTPSMPTRFGHGLTGLHARLKHSFTNGRCMLSSPADKVRSKIGQRACLLGRLPKCRGLARGATSSAGPRQSWRLHLGGATRKVFNGSIFIVE